MRRYGSKPPSAQHKRTMLGALLVQHENLDALDVASLARSYGMTPAEVIAARDAETTRRRVAGRSV